MVNTYLLYSAIEIMIATLFRSLKVLFITLGYTVSYRIKVLFGRNVSFQISAHEWAHSIVKNANISISRKWMFQSCAYLGHQKSVIDWKTWWQFNTGMKVQLNENHSVGLRGEVFRDTKSVVLLNNNNGLVSAYTAYFDYKVSQHLWLRSEIKRLKIDNLEKSKWLAMLNLSLVF